NGARSRTSRSRSRCRSLGNEKKHYTGSAERRNRRDSAAEEGPGSGLLGEEALGVRPERADEIREERERDAVQHELGRVHEAQQLFVREDRHLRVGIGVLDSADDDRTVVELDPVALDPPVDGRGVTTGAWLVRSGAGERTVLWFC